MCLKCEKNSNMDFWNTSTGDVYGVAQIKMFFFLVDWNILT